MNALFFILVSLFFIILQTIVLPSFQWFPHCFDMVIINILFLSLLYSNYGVLGAVILIGLIMDSISGCAFFHHVFSYVWVYLLVQLFKQFVFQKSVVFIFLISAVSVAIQQGFAFFSMFIIQGSASQGDFSVLIKQVGLALMVIPLSIWFLNRFRYNWLYMGKIMKKRMIQKYRD